MPMVLEIDALIECHSSLVSSLISSSSSSSSLSSSYALLDLAVFYSTLDSISLSLFHGKLSCKSARDADHKLRTPE